MDKNVGKVVENFKTLKINSVENIITGAVSKIDSVTTIIMSSIIAKPDIIEQLEIVKNNVRKSVSLIRSVLRAISDGIQTMNIEIAKINRDNLLSIIDAGKFSAITSIKMLLKNRNTQYEGVTAILYAYASMIEIISKISQFAETIKKRKVKKSIKSVPSIMRVMISSLLKLNGLSKLIQKLNLAQVYDEIFILFNAVIGRIIESMNGVVRLAEIQNSLGGSRGVNKIIRKSINSIFRLMIRTIIYMSLIGKLLIKYFKNIMTSVALLPVYAASLNLFITLLSPVIQQLVELGNNGKYVRRGLRVLHAVLFGSLKYRTIGLIRIYKKLSRYKINPKPIVILSLISASMLMMSNVLNAIINLGKNYIQGVLGIKLLGIILFGGMKGESDSNIHGLMYLYTRINRYKIKPTFIITIGLLTLGMLMIGIIQNILIRSGSQYMHIKLGLLVVSLILEGSNNFLKKQKSLISIVTGISAKDRKKIKDIIPTIGYLTIISTLLMTISLELMIIGRYRRYVRRGIKTIGYFTNLIDYIADIGTKLKKRKLTNEKLWEIGKSLMLSVGIFAIIAFELSLIGLNVLGITLSIIALTIMRLSLAILIWNLIYISKNEKQIKKSIPAIIAINSIIETLSEAFQNFLIAGLTLLIIGQATICMVAMVGGVFAVMIILLVISKIGTNSIRTSVINLALCAVAIAIVVKALVSSSEGMKQVNGISILLLVGYSVLLLGLFTLIGLATPALGLALVGMTAFILLSTALLLLVLPLIVLAMIDSELIAKSEENARLVVTTSLNILKMIFNAQYELVGGEETDGVVKKCLLGFFGTAGTFIEGLLMFALLATTFLSVIFIYLTAELLIGLNNLDLSELSNVGTTVDAVINTALQIIQRATQRAPQGEKDQRGGIGGIIGKVFPSLQNMIDGVMSFGFLAVTMAAVGMVWLVAKEISYLETLQLNSGVIENNVNHLFGISKRIVDIASDKQYQLEKPKEKIKNAKHIHKLLKIIYKSSKLISKIGENNSDNGFNNVINNYIKFIDRINSADLKKLETTTQLFAKMAEFSASINGNFEGLAEVLNERIMPLLEELKNVLSGTTEASGNIVGTISNTNTQAPTNESVVPTGAQQAGGNSKDYTSVLETLKNEISNIEDILTNGTMITRMNPY